LTTEQYEMKAHLEEQAERLRTQLAEVNSILTDKEKEVKQLKLKELIMDTHNFNLEGANLALNRSTRHSQTVRMKK